MVDGIGKRLEEARKARGWSVQDAARATKIQPARIEDLEKDEYRNFPSVVYARNFLVLYAKHLGVDADEVSERLTPAPVIDLEGYDYLKGGAAIPPPEPSAERKASSTSANRSALPFLFIVALIAGGIAYGIWYLNTNMERLGIQSGATASPTPSPEPSPAAAVPSAPAASPTPVESPAVAGIEPEPTPYVEPRMPAPLMEEVPAEDGIQVMRALPANAPDPATAEPRFRVELRGKKRTWVKIVPDDPDNTPLHDNWLNPGETIVHVGRRFHIEILDKGAVDVFKNGQQIADPPTDLVIE